MYGKPVLNTGVPVWFRNHHTFECYILSGYSTMSHQTAPLPHYRQPSLTLHCSITFTHLKDNYSIVKLPYLFKKQRGNLYGWGYRDILYTNVLYTWQSLYELSLYRTEFTRDKVYTGQILYGDKIYTRTKFIRGQSLYEDKVYTNFFHTVLELKDIKWC